MRLPTATYRLQFGDELDFAKARELLPYLDDLGVSDVYASPLLAARPGTSGYHVIDPTQLEPSLGGRGAFESFTDALRTLEMGLVLDVVPNHMAASNQNPWWRDVLRRGRESEYATFFDVDWDRLGGKILVPALDAPLQDVLDRGALTVGVEAGEPVVRHHEHVFPVDPRTVGGAGGIEELLDRQPYVLAHWRDGAADINYRRFFDLSDLVAVRQEEPAVFEATHALVLELVRDGAVTGLRIDHVDGLRDPFGYLTRLRAAVGPDVPIWVEKILGPGESLPSEWPVQGTTGYEFASAANDVLLDADGLERLGKIARDHTRRDDPFVDVVAAKKRQVMDELFSGQVRRIVETARRALGRGAPAEPALAEAFVELTARLPVYRTYVRDRMISNEDRRIIGAAARDAKRHLSGAARAATDELRSLLLLERGGKRALAVVLDWQQLTPAVAAKGVEDTALYDDAVLLSRDDVGFDPGGSPGGVDAFHRFQRDRARRWPHALSATSTHDSKRSEDGRARLDVLSEIPDRWRRALRAWTKAAASRKHVVDGDPVPDPTEELAVYQALIAIEPFGDEPPGPLEFRIEEFARKAARERKVHTSWTDPDEKYEDALVAFVRDVRSSPEPEIQGFARKLGIPAAANALAQALWKLTAPGIPDLYRGTERWWLALVDPDNRRPADVDAARRAIVALDECSPAELLESWPDGRIKLHLTRVALELRRTERELFSSGSYLPLAATGELADHVVAFARRSRSHWAITITPRLVAGLRGGDSFPLGRRWSDTAVTLPARAPGSWRDALTGSTVTAPNGSLPLADALSTLPVALLVPAA